MSLGLLLRIAAVVLFVLAVIASAVVSGTCLGVSTATWFCAGLLTIAVIMLVDRVAVQA